MCVCVWGGEYRRVSYGGTFRVEYHKKIKTAKLCSELYEYFHHENYQLHVYGNRIVVRGRLLIEDTSYPWLCSLSTQVTVNDGESFFGRLRGLGSWQALRR